MKIHIDGNISAFYVQTLCLLFFPGSKFSEKAEDGVDVFVSVKRSRSTLKADVAIVKDGKEFRADYELADTKNLTRPSMAEKIAVGKAFLKAGEFACGIVPPWGLLTGVRPSKLARWNLESGMTVDETAKALVDEYSVTEEKALLAARVADAERRIITPDLYGKCSLYIAIPFCPTRCSYCSFVSYTSERLLSLIPDYISVLTEEIRREASLIKSLGMELSCIYIGGGTPTVLDEKLLEVLLRAVNDNFDISSLREYTVEAGRPDTITRGKAELLKKYGVGRVSVNTQTLNDEILRSVGRRHNSEDFFRAYETVRSAGIDNVNVDLIAGLPGESAESFICSAQRIAELRPENVTVHSFCVKKSAELKDHGVYDPTDAASRSVAASQKILIDSSYLPYYMYRQKNAVGNLENVGFTLPSHEGIYNILMMEEIQSIFAVGASAVSKLVKIGEDGKMTIKRFAECKYPYEYLREKSETAAAVASRRRDAESFFRDE